MSHASETRQATRGDWQTAFRGGLALFALGMVGVFALAVSVVPALRETPGLESLSYPLLLAVAAINSTLFLLVFTAIGTYAAPRVGLGSHVYDWATGRGADWSQLRDSLALAVGLGVGLFVVVAILDALFAPFVSISTSGVVSDAETLRALASSVPMRLLYGGITEELLLRWGVMAPLALVGWRALGVVSDGTDRPTDATMWAAIVLAAVLFGAGHLPALAASFDLSAALVGRTILLNALVGIGLGWLFWRRSLEAAMVAHASFHVALIVVSVGLVVVT